MLVLGCESDGSSCRAYTGGYGADQRADDCCLAEHLNQTKLSIAGVVLEM